MKAFLCSMHDEQETVAQSLASIREHHKQATVILAVSGHRPKELEQYCDLIIPLPDLVGQHEFHALGSYSLCRNYSAAFSVLYRLKEHKYIACFNGDTLIRDATTFDRIHKRMQKQDALAAISQAIGQDFHSDDADPANGRCGGRMQTYDVADFAHCLWMLDGPWAWKHRAFEYVKVTNRYCSEQCFGDELARHLPDFKQKILRLNEDNPHYTYAYSDGVDYHHGQQFVGRK